MGMGRVSAWVRGGGGVPGAHGKCMGKHVGTRHWG